MPPIAAAAARYLVKFVISENPPSASCSNVSRRSPREASHTEIAGEFGGKTIRRRKRTHEPKTTSVSEAARVASGGDDHQWNDRCLVRPGLLRRGRGRLRLGIAAVDADDTHGVGRRELLMASANGAPAPRRGGLLLTFANQEIITILWPHCPHLRPVRPQAPFVVSRSAKMLMPLIGTCPDALPWERGGVARRPTAARSQAELPTA